eukprot:10134337-Karenia_brevis.AAC.1
MYMQNRCGDSTAPSRIPSVSRNGSPRVFPSSRILQLKSKTANIKRHRPNETPHWNILCISILRLKDGNAVRRSTNKTYKRRL